MPVFLHPLWLLLPLLVIPAALIAHAVHLRHGGKLGPLVPERLRARLLPPGGGHLPAARLASRFFLLALLGIALARPQLGEEGVVETADARDILLAIDTSRSMLAADVPPSRIELAKLSSLDLIKALPDDRFGVLAFAGSAFPLAPLTTDHDAVRETIASIDTETLPVGGTDLGAAVQTAMEAFDEPGPRQRAMVILSDGEDLEGKFQGVAAKAKDKGILIFAFAIGTAHGAMLPDARTQGGFIRDGRGQPVVSRSSLDALQQLSAATGGYAMMLAGPGSLPAQMNDALRRLESASTEEKTRRQAAEQFQWPLGLALLCFVVCLLLRPAGQRGKESRSPVPGASPIMPMAILLALIGLSAGGVSPARAASTGKDAPSNQSNLSNATDPAAQAAMAHKNADFTRAIETAGPALIGATPERRALVSANLGNSLYESGRTGLPEDDKKWTISDMEKALVDWEDGLGHLDHSLRLRPSNKGVEENRTRVAGAIEELRRRLKEKQDEEQKQKEQEQKEQQKKQEQKDQKSEQGEGQQSQKGQQGQEKQEGRQGDPGGDGQKPDQRPGDEGQQPEGQQGQEGKDPTEEGKKDGEGKEQNKKDGQGKDGEQAKQQEGQEGEPKDASSGERPAGRATAQSIPMQIGPDGRILLPEDPRERARFLEAVRRNLQQRSMEEKNVRLIPAPKDSRRPDKDW